MKKSIFRLGIAAFCLFVGPRSVFSQPAPDTTTIRGTVVDEKGLPIGGASVTLQRPMQIGGMAFWGGVTYTDAHGDFAFEDAEDGTYRLTIEAAGFAAIQNGSEVINDATGALHFSMQGLGTQPFRLLGPDGTALHGRQVSIAFFDEGSGQQVSQNPMVGGDSIARMASLVPGTYRVESIVPDVGYAILDKLEVKSGMNPSVDLAYKLGGTLRVVAVGQNGDKKVPVGGVDVAFSRVGAVTGPTRPTQQWMFALGDGGRFARITRDGDGTAIFANLPPGEYEVSGSLPTGLDDSNRMIQGMKAQVVAGATAEVTLDCKAIVGAHILATVVHPDGKPAADIDVPFIAQEFEEPTSTTDGARRRGLLAQYERRGHTDATGHFDIYPLPAGHWTIRPLASERGRRADMPTVDATVAKAGAVTLEVP